VQLEGRVVRLELLNHRHAEGLAEASAIDPTLYRWSPVPQGKTEAEKYIQTALSWQKADTAVPFAIIRRANSEVIGSTRFWNIERWAWPAPHERHGREVPDACEIGYTWLKHDAVRTAVNTECKLLMLTHAFERWQVLRVCFHADVRNDRSRAALERLGAKFEGILRSHRMAVDFRARDSARYSIVKDEWPLVKDRIVGFLREYREARNTPWAL
jgi:RimJ/RimL family protein N-acetyltransferase